MDQQGSTQTTTPRTLTRSSITRGCLACLGTGRARYDEPPGACTECAGSGRYAVLADETLAPGEGTGMVIGKRMRRHIAEPCDGWASLTREVWYDGALLDPVESLTVYDHSPSGFEWAYSGSGPAQLALALALRICADPEEAQRCSFTLKETFIAPAPQARFEIPIAALERWLESWRTQRHNAAAS